MSGKHSQEWRVQIKVEPSLHWCDARETDVWSLTPSGMLYWRDLLFSALPPPIKPTLSIIFMCNIISVWRRNVQTGLYISTWVVFFKHLTTNYYNKSTLPCLIYISKHIPAVHVNVISGVNILAVISFVYILSVLLIEIIIRLSRGLTNSW